MSSERVVLKNVDRGKVLMVLSVLVGFFGIVLPNIGLIEKAGKSAVLGTLTLVAMAIIIFLGRRVLGKGLVLVLKALRWVLIRLLKTAFGLILAALTIGGILAIGLMITALATDQRVDTLTGRAVEFVFEKLGWPEPTPTPEAEAPKTAPAAPVPTQSPSAPVATAITGTVQTGRTPSLLPEPYWVVGKSEARVIRDLGAGEVVTATGQARPNWVEVLDAQGNRGFAWSPWINWSGDLGSLPQILELPSAP